MKKDVPAGLLEQCPVPINRTERIQLAHGSGGRLMSDLIERVFMGKFNSPELHRKLDSATLPKLSKPLVFTTDSYVVDPIFFPGSDIGELAICGTVNDLSMSGACPLFISVGFILEEGLDFESLETVVTSMSRAAVEAGVEIVTGDTKVVNRGSADKLFINTSGIGCIEHHYDFVPEQIRIGDRVLLSGTVADHGIAVLTGREGLSFESSVVSDTAPLNRLVATMIAAGGEGIRVMRDPTRGGVASALNELAEAAGIEMVLSETEIPVQPAVAGACELLGFDPLYVANEGKLVAVVSPEHCEVILGAMRSHPLGRNAALIGEVVEGRAGLVSMRTAIGGSRIVDMMVGEQLPRIC
jgi:hydrogenase expression/formation protein HypE